MLRQSVRAGATGVALACLASCGGVNAYRDPAKAHHTDDGFRNNHIGTIDKGLGELLRWQFERVRGGLPGPAQTPTPLRAPDLAAIRGYATGAGAAPAGPPAITWIGHASVLVQAGGLNILTDPMFSERASPVQFIGPKRAQPPGIALADLPPIDVVLISHNHYDHLDKASVREIARRSAAVGKPAVFLVPLGLKAWFAAAGVDNAVEMDWWDRYVLRGVEFNFTPLQHWSSRGPGDRNRTLWGGYAVFAPEFHWYFSGDSGYSKDFADTRARFADRQTPPLGGGFDLALIAIGAYEPRWFMASQHVDPAEAVAVHQDLGAKRSVGVHWGTFELTDESLDQPPKDLAAARMAQGVGDAEFGVMAIGETRFFPARSHP